VFLGILPIQCKTGAIDLLAIPGIDFYRSLFHIRWSSAWCANILLLCSLENNVPFRI